MIFLIFLVLLGNANAKYYSDCGSKLATLHSVEATGCADDSKQCVLKRNTNATMRIVFTPNVDADNIEAEVHGIVMNLPIPFPLPEPEACKDSGLTCPIKAGKKATYTSSLPILKSYPKLNVDVKWELKTDDGVLVCILVASKIN